MKRRISHTTNTNTSPDRNLFALLGISFCFVVYVVCDFSIFLVHNLSLIFQLYVYFFEEIPATDLFIDIRSVNSCVSHWRPVENFNKWLIFFPSFFSWYTRTRTRTKISYIHTKYLRRLTTKLLPNATIPICTYHTIGMQTGSSFVHSDIEFNEFI